MGLGIKRRLRTYIVQWIRRRGNLLRELAATEEMKRTIISDDGFLHDIIHSDRGRAAIEETAFLKERLLAVLQRNGFTPSAYREVLEMLGGYETLPQNLLQNTAALVRLFENALQDAKFACGVLNSAELQKKALDHVEFRNILLNAPELQQAAVQNGAYVKKMIETPEFERAATESASIREKILRVPGFQESALGDQSFRAKIVRDETLQQEIIRAASKNSLWQPAFSELLETILRDSRLYPILFEHQGLAGRFIQESVKSEEIRRRLVRQPALRLEALAELVRGPLWQEDCQDLLEKIVWDKRTHERLFADPKLLELLLTNDAAIIKTAQLPPVRWKLQLLHARERAAQLPYLLPAVVLSYPRAGSNFLQSVLQGSSGFWCQSIYAPFSEIPDSTLTVKSHSPSPKYFEDEWQRLLPGRPLPAKIIRLQRDPRDVLVSFIEYTESKRKTVVRQEEFLNEVDYFYASTIDRDFKRSVYKNGMTVAQAFREHVRTWYAESPPDCYEILPVRYEDLVLEPQETFKKIFDFLNLDCELAEKFLRVKVSLYSDTGRPRAQIQGWRKNLERYGTLLQMVQEELAEEIRLLGYEEAEASDTTDTP